MSVQEKQTLGAAAHKMLLDPLVNLAFRSMLDEIQTELRDTPREASATRESLYLEGKSLHGRRVTVARLGALSAIRDCDLLYVGADEAPSLARIVELLGDAAVLTVTDAPPPQPAAVVIVAEGKRLAFEIDVERCRRAGLKPGAALLGLARNLRRPAS